MQRPAENPDTIAAPRPPRPLRLEECALIQALATRADYQTLWQTLRMSWVRTLHDGGMGSIAFVSSENPVMGRELISAGYLDSDDVLVSISINLDKQNDLFEVDFWKVDFSPLLRYPKPEDLIF